MKFIYNLIVDLTSGLPDMPMTDSGGVDLRRIKRDLVAIGPMSFSDTDLEDIECLSRIVAEQVATRDALPQPGRAYMALPIKRKGELAHVFYIAANGKTRYSGEDISLDRLEARPVTTLCIACKKKQETFRHL